MLLQQRSDIRPAPAEFHERIERIATTAAREDGFQEAARGGVIEHSGLLECGEGISSEHFRPLVTVVARSITAREDVPEAVCEPVPRWHRYDCHFAPHLTEDLADATTFRGIV